MLQPRTPEDDWLTVLEGIPSWQVSPQRTIFVCPHPDDEVLGAGGLLAELARRTDKLTVVAVTDGEAAYPDEKDLATVRRGEQEKALLHLGVTSAAILRLHLPDAHVAAHEQDLVDQLVPLLDKTTMILAPWIHDVHPDHEACGRAAESAARLTGARQVSYFFWAWHHLRPEQLLSPQLRVFRPDDELQRRKAEALAAYESQITRHAGEPILPAHLLAPAQRSFETFLLHE